MNVKLYSSELNRMLKTVSQCIDSKSPNLGNIEIIYDNNLLSIRATNGHVSVVMSTPVLGGDGTAFCVDGTMFCRVCAMCNGEIEISTDGKVCTIKGAGRTRIPIVGANIPAFQRVTGNEFTVKADAFTKGYNGVAYAISQDQSRVVLTGVLMDSTDSGIRMVTLDGFRMAMEDVSCDADGIHAVVPGFFMKLVAASTVSGEVITFRTDGKRIQATTDSMMLACSLLSGDFPDYQRITPTEFKTKALVDVDSLQRVLKIGSVVNTRNNLVKLVIQEDYITVMSNSEDAEFDANVPCKQQGDIIPIAFNHKYLMETIASIDADEIMLMFNSPISPCIVKRNDTTGFRLILPVRVAG